MTKSDYVLVLKALKYALSCRYIDGTTYCDLVEVFGYHLAKENPNFSSAAWLREAAPNVKETK